MESLGIAFTSSSDSCRSYCLGTTIFFAKPENVSLFANTKLKIIGSDKKAKLQDQPLEWHLHQVGDRASRIAVQMMTDLSLSGLSEQTVEYICQPTTHPRFQWQNIAANALQKYTEAS